jgi:hypothetical protein
VLFLPVDACDDLSSRKAARQDEASSFGHAVRVLRYRGGREEPDWRAELFERLWIGLYDVEALKGAEGAESGCVFFDVERDPPRGRRPRLDEVILFPQLIEEITATYERRNPRFRWAED